jgi:hypothetical protein
VGSREDFEPSAGVELSMVHPHDYSFE